MKFITAFASLMLVSVQAVNVRNMIESVMKSKIDSLIELETDITAKEEELNRLQNMMDAFMKSVDHTFVEEGEEEGEEAEDAELVESKEEGEEAEDAELVES